VVAIEQVEHENVRSRAQSRHINGRVFKPRSKAATAWVWWEGGIKPAGRRDNDSNDGPWHQNRRDAIDLNASIAAHNSVVV